MLKKRIRPIVIHFVRTKTHIFIQCPVLDKPRCPSPRLPEAVASAHASVHRSRGTADAPDRRCELTSPCRWVQPPVLFVDKKDRAALATVCGGDVGVAILQHRDGIGPNVISVPLTGICGCLAFPDAAQQEHHHVGGPLRWDEPKVQVQRGRPRDADSMVHTVHNVERSIRKH